MHAGTLTKRERKEKKKRSLYGDKSGGKKYKKEKEVNYDKVHYIDTRKRRRRLCGKVMSVSI